MFSEVISVIWQAVIGLLLKLDGIVYDLVCYFYEIFLFLSELDIFKNEDYYNIVRRIYIILGVIMLFILSYSLLRAVINPDNFSKGENSFGNIIKNVLVSLVIITLLPTVFEVANRVQNVILNSDVIGKLILSENFTTGVVADGGRKMASTVFQAFLRLDDNIGNADIEQDPGLVAAAWQDAFSKVEQGQSFKLFAIDFDYNGETIFFPELIAKNAVSYTMIVSTLAGGFLLWTILLFCFDLGIRVIKLIYYQLIAPIAVICRVLPGKKAKPIFDNWLKYTLSTYAEVFIRIIIMYLGIYLITLIRDRMGNIFSAASESGLGGFQQALVVAFLVMGVVAFIRQAPKLIQNVFGIETGGMNLGFKGLFERVGAGGGFAAGALVGGTIGGFGQRLRDARAAGRGWKSGLSAIAGGIGGGRRAFMKNLGSKSMDDFRKNTAEGINATLEKGRKNDQERAQFGNRFRAKQNAVREFLGVNPDVAALDRQINSANETASGVDAIEKYAEDILNKNKTNSMFAANLSDKDYIDKGIDPKLANEFVNLMNGKSVGTVEQIVSQMESSLATTNYTEKAKQKWMDELTDNGMNVNDAELMVNDFSQVEELQKRAQSIMADDAERVNQFKAMTTQLTKASVEKVANEVAAGNDFGGAINEQTQASLNALVESAIANVDNSKLHFEATYDRKSPDIYSQLDKIRKEAKTSSYELSSQKQKIMREQGKGN